MRFTIDEYSKQFKMSKELINSKLRSKKLNYITENNTTYIIISKKSLSQENKEEINQQDMPKKSPETNQTVLKKNTTVGMILSLYQRENAQLKQKIDELENKIDSLIDDKEQMLREERDKIEEVYKAKDEQLKNMLEIINKKLLLEQKTETIYEVSLNESDSANTSYDNFLFVELKHYLKTLDIEPYQRKIIKRRFLDAKENDIRIMEQNGKIFLDFAKYDYSDLLKY